MCSDKCVTLECSVQCRVVFLGQQSDSSFQLDFPSLRTEGSESLGPPCYLSS